MNDERRYLNDAEKTEGLARPEGKIEASVVSRRRALLAGLSAAPAVLTLLSRSAFAQTTPLSCTAALSLFAGASLRPGVNRPTQEEVNQACADLRDLKNTDSAEHGLPEERQRWLKDHPEYQDKILHPGEAAPFKKTQ
jgi:hypothetical protein